MVIEENFVIGRCQTDFFHAHRGDHKYFPLNVDLTLNNYVITGHSDDN